MALTDVGKVVVLRCSYDSIADAFERDEEAQALEGWEVFVAANQARFAARRHGEATLLMPRIGFESVDELSVHLREILGDMLDEHLDDRGLAWLPEAPEPDDDASYAKLVEGEHEWAEKIAKDDERLNKTAGSLFGAAAKGLQTEQRVVTRVEASAVAAPLEKAKDKLEKKTREDRSSMRRSLLGASVGSPFLDSPLTKEPDPSSGGDEPAELTSNLQEAVEGDVAAALSEDEEE